MRRKSKISSADYSKFLNSSATSHKILKCSTASCENKVKVDNAIVSVLCWHCTADLVPFIQKTVVEKSDKPAGWRFMKEFVDKDGNVYHSGEEQPNLKGTLPSTDVDAIKAHQKEKKAEKKATKASREEKKQAKLLKLYEKKQKLKKKEEEKEAKEEVKRQKEEMKERNEQIKSKFID